MMEETRKYKDLALSEDHFDALKEICNIGMGHAATALNQMIGKTIHLTVPEAGLVHFDEIPELMGGADLVVAGIYFQIQGEVKGNILFIFPRRSTKNLCALLTGTEPEDDLSLSELHSSALMEIGNILASNYLAALERLLGKSMSPSVPGVAYDMAGAIVDGILMRVGEEVDQPLVVRASFMDEDHGVDGHLCLLLDPDSLRAILLAAKALSEETAGG